LCAHDEIAAPARVWERGLWYPFYVS
jgi:hypothetical protein